MKLTNEEIEAGKSAKGGWTAKTLYKWGVPWPPPKGWRAALLAGTPIPKRKNGKTIKFRSKRYLAKQKKLDAAWKNAVDSDA